MRRAVVIVVAAAAALFAVAQNVTTTLAYEDQRERETRAAVSNDISRAVAPLATTNDLAQTARRVKMDAMRHYQSITNAAAGLDYATHQSTLYEVISNYNMMLKILKGDFE